MWRMRTNAELNDVYKEPDIVTTIKQGRIRWRGHVQRVTEERAVIKVFIGGQGGRRARGRPRRRWVDDVDEDLRSCLLYTSLGILP